MQSCQCSADRPDHTHENILDPLAASPASSLSQQLIVPAVVDHRDLENALDYDSLGTSSHRD
ncbi:MAG: hypothetical protein KME35_24265 [Aphanocapsa sp. GSE-SYN-MK-11-07L]|nr:hypothetical protein [Aphanocapsa sp. GSE-SYN-MK-11-07L]